MRRFIWFCGVCVGLVQVVAFGAPRQGLSVSFEVAGKMDAREARLVALMVPEGAAATPLLPAGRFTAIWNGTISSPLRAQYTFSAEVWGEVKVTIDGKTVLSGGGA